MTNTPLVSMTGISKSFSGQRVLDEVDFQVLRGEVHILAGENGAGKSTLMRILIGALSADSGSIELESRRFTPRHPQDAARAGIAMIHQELSLVPALSVLDNVMLGREPTHWGIFVRERERRSRARELLNKVNLDIDLDTTVQALPIATRQLIEIAKALAFGHRVLIMDEPTSALRVPEAERLFDLMHELTTGANPIGIVFISHRMEEIYRLAHRISVLRDGRLITTSAPSVFPRDELVRAMVGREISEQIKGIESTVGDELLTVENLHARDQGQDPVRDVSFNLRAGEVLGLAGLQGSGCSTLLHALFGDASIKSGSITVQGSPMATRFTSRDALRRGIILVTADRRTTGVLPEMSVNDNLLMPSWPLMSRSGIRPTMRERNIVRDCIDGFNVRCRTSGQAMRTLSGGNQQKVVLGRWSPLQPRIVLLDDPTRGVDIGSKQEIYEIINRWKSEGRAILLTSTELPELIGLADRVLVMHRGRAVAVLSQSEMSAEGIIAAAMGETALSTVTEGVA